MMPGNPVVGGTVLRRAAIASPNYAAGTAGWTINADGSAEFNNLTIRGTFDGTDYELNSSGAFFYSGTPALGNLVISIAPAAGTDAHGNPYVSGLAAYAAIAGTTYAVQIGEATVGGSPTPGLFLDNQGASPPSESPVYSFGNASSSGAAAVMYSGKATAGSAASAVEAADSALSGTTGGELDLLAGRVMFGHTLAAMWDDNGSQLNLPSSGGPFIAGESFHPVSLASGVTGTLRVKLLPWNAVWIDAQLANTATGTVNLGSLPSSAYYPVSARNFPLAVTGSGSTYLHLPASGAVQLIATAAGNPGGSIMYPTN